MYEQITKGVCHQYLQCTVMKLKCGFFEKKEGLRALSWSQNMLKTGETMMGNWSIPQEESDQ